VEEHKITEEEQRQRNRIFAIFSKCYSETSSRRLEVYFPSLSTEVFIWYRDYLHANVDKIGVEIVKVIKHFIEDETISKVPQDEDGFFKYLSVSIKREKVGSQREYNDKYKIKIPKEKKRKLRELEDFIRMEESQLGRELTADERSQSISKWFNMTEEKAKEYLKLIDKKYVVRLDLLEDVLPSTYGNPENNFFENFNTAILREAVESVLNKKQDRSRDCYRALFTLFCVKNNLRRLYPVLDQEIIDAFYKNDKKPKQYEIYLKYHPETDRESAEAMASKNLKEFLNDIETCLKEKNR
jgi:uncharacterized protein YdeI (YjbR/CyaY-like superfamily)